MPDASARDAPVLPIAAVKRAPSHVTTGYRCAMPLSVADMPTTSGAMAPRRRRMSPVGPDATDTRSPGVCGGEVRHG